MSLKARLTKLEEQLAPILDRHGRTLTVKQMTDLELEFLILQQCPGIDLNDDQALLGLIAAEKSKHEAIGPNAN